MAEAPPPVAPRPQVSQGYQANPLASEQQQMGAYDDDPPPPPMPAGGPAAIDRVQQFDNEGGNEGGELMRTQQDGIEYVKRRDFEARFDDPSNIEPTESHKGAGFIFLVFTFIIVIAMAVSIEIVNGGNIWGLGEELGLGHLFPLEFQAPQYIPPRTCGDKNGDHVPDDTLMNCNSTMLVAAGLPESDTWAVVSPRAETECEPKGEKCQPEVCCVDLGPNCEDDPPAGSTYNTAWALGDGGCAQGEGCGETRLPDTQTAAECLAAVKAANDAATPTIFVSADNSWPPAGIPQGVSANGVTWGRGTPEDPNRIQLALVENDINHGTYKQCYAEFRMTEAVPMTYVASRMMDMTDQWQTCRIAL